MSKALHKTSKPYNLNIHTYIFKRCQTFFFAAGFLIAVFAADIFGKNWLKGPQQLIPCSTSAEPTTGGEFKDKRAFGANARTRWPR
jgi:hypothetical protein